MKPGHPDHVDLVNPVSKLFARLVLDYLKSLGTGGSARSTSMVQHRTISFSGFWPLKADPNADFCAFGQPVVGLGNIK